jgi:hypothetical protein
MFAAEPLSSHLHWVEVELQIRGPNEGLLDIGGARCGMWFCALRFVG